MAVNNARHIEDLTYMSAHVLLNLLNELGKTNLINSITQEHECEILFII